MKIVIVAGGTGGHLYPGIAVARRLAGCDVLFVVRRGDLGRDILRKEGFQVEEIAGQGLPRDFSFRLFTFPFKFLLGWVETILLLRRVRPDRVLSMGGYLSVPAILTARILGIGTLLHEQNVYPGLANRFLSRWADSVALSFSASEPYFKEKKVWLSGLPIRPEIGQVDQTSGRRHFGLGMEIPTVLVFGGSLGAQRLNTLVTETWPLLIKRNIRFQVLHVTGAKDFERVERLYQAIKISAKVLPYCHDMDLAYAAADVVVCRAGASTVAELMVVKRPALVVPYPFASNNHQLYNARVLEKSGLGHVVLDDALTSSVIADFIAESLSNKSLEFSTDPAPADAASRLAAFLTSGKMSV